jgi:hypothetical protein
MLRLSSTRMASLALTFLVTDVVPMVSAADDDVIAEGEKLARANQEIFDPRFWDKCLHFDSPEEATTFRRGVGKIYEDSRAQLARRSVEGNLKAGFAGQYFLKEVEKHQDQACMNAPPPKGSAATQRPVAPDPSAPTKRWQVVEIPKAPAGFEYQRRPDNADPAPAPADASNVIAVGKGLEADAKQLMNLHRWDRCLRFETRADETAFREREAEARTYVREQLALHTAVGNLNASGRMVVYLLAIRGYGDPDCLNGLPSQDNSYASPFGRGSGH